MTMAVMLFLPDVEKDELDFSEDRIGFLDVQFFDN